MNEISGAFLDLHRRLDLVAIKEFVTPDGQDIHEGRTAIGSWIEYVEVNHGTNLKDLRFGSPTTQALIDTANSLNGKELEFWDQLSFALNGIHLRDWNDQSEEKFIQALKDAKSNIEYETEDLLEGGSVVSISLDLPGRAKESYRFRSPESTEQGERILQNFITTMEISGRPLSADEKRLITVDLMRYVMGVQLKDDG